MNGFKLLERPYITTFGEYLKKANYIKYVKAGAAEYRNNSLCFCIYSDNHRIAFCHEFNPPSHNEWIGFMLNENDTLFINEDCQILMIPRYRIAISY